MTDAAPAEAPDNEVPRVLLVTPHYGQVSMGLLHTINGAVKDHSLIQVVMHAQSSNSVLPHCFNQLLGVALDQRDAGNVTHLAMVHSDVIAERGWLDKLWCEMWHHGADLVSAVIPIKGMTGRTSTAIGSKADRWDVRRCVYLKDRKRLPRTFGPEAVCSADEVLLVNTGLFLADLRRPFWDTFSFQFHTRLVRHVPPPFTKKGPDGAEVEVRPAPYREANCRSEDWEMSHDLNDAGLKYMATWAVKLRHDGAYKFPNHEESAA